MWGRVFGASAGHSRAEAEHPELFNAVQNVVNVGQNFLNVVYVGQDVWRTYRAITCRDRRTEVFNAVQNIFML